MIIGTAGHVDHGKSALVTALTGQSMDRLLEERRRGITIDLNFARFELAPGIVAGIVDVPGHEDLVRTMVAGASGMDVAMLVVAADEGIMPQTREHLLVLEQLAVPLGVAVITKMDAADPEWLELVRDDLAEWLEKSSVPFGPPVVTSARTGQGLEELRARLLDVAQSLARREANDLFRLPIDRVFTVAGTGTVVTGTAISGSVMVGEAVTLLPSGREGRVRSIESHGTPLEHSMPGARTAVALSGVERSEIARGEVLVRSSDPWEATTRFDAELTLGRGAAALADRSRVRVHHGTAEVMARVRLDAPLEPGSRAVARLALESPLVARGGDRLVLRSYSPVMVIGGGKILDPLPDSRRRTQAGLMSDDARERLEALTARRRLGLQMRLLPVLTGLAPAACDALLARTPSLVSAGGLLVRAAEVERLSSEVVRTVAAFHRQQPHENGMSVETLRQSLRVPEALADTALSAAQNSGQLRIRAGLVTASGFRPVARASEADRQRLVAAVKEAGLAAPTVEELADRLGVSEAAAGLREAADRGDVIRLEPGRYLSPEALEGFATLVREVGSTGEITPGALRDRTGLSRKFLIPLLEWADRSGITIRQGEGRRLRTPHPGAARGA